MKKNEWQKAFELKDLPRAGWLRKGIAHPESVAAHSWGLAMLCLEFGPRIHPPLNMERVLTLALIHDLPEVHAGDITPHDGVSKVEKQEIERRSATQLLNPTMLEFWKEYDANLTPESTFVHSMDKIDMALQAVVYQTQTDTTEFLLSAWKRTPEKWRWIWNELGINKPPF